jgi:cytochrome c oxidase subunit 2
MRQALASAGVVAVVCGLLVWGCGPKAPKPEGAKPPVSDQLSGQVADGVREVKVEAKQWAFTPDRIVVKKGEKVRLVVTSMDVEHGLGIEAFNINHKLPPHQPQTIEFTPDKAGEFEFHCTVYCGAGHGGMKGTLVVQQ